MWEQVKNCSQTLMQQCAVWPVTIISGPFKLNL
uniref:Uncharacterized protein n=1 Tax=Anguilla anguilla TaxID=7936 RepID=A0A0E9W368_ANGAN